MVIARIGHRGAKADVQKFTFEIKRSTCGIDLVKAVFFDVYVHRKPRLRNDARRAAMPTFLVKMGRACWYASRRQLTLLGQEGE